MKFPSVTWRILTLAFGPVEQGENLIFILIYDTTMFAPTLRPRDEVSSIFKKIRSSIQIYSHMKPKN